MPPLSDLLPNAVSYVLWLASCMGMSIVVFQSPLVADIIRLLRPRSCRLIYTHGDVQAKLAELLHRQPSSIPWKLLFGYLSGVWSCAICQSVLISAVASTGFHATACPDIPILGLPITFLASIPLIRWLQRLI
jgi:hypothetical protein